MRRNATFAIVLLLAFLFVPLASAQVFKVQGGASTMINADGASVDFLAPNYQGTFGVGYFQDHFGVG